MAYLGSLGFSVWGYCFSMVHPGGVYLWGVAFQPHPIDAIGPTFVGFLKKHITQGFYSSVYNAFADTMLIFMNELSILSIHVNLASMC